MYIISSVSLVSSDFRTYLCMYMYVSWPSVCVDIVLIIMLTMQIFAHYILCSYIYEQIENDVIIPYSGKIEGENSQNVKYHCIRVYGINVDHIPGVCH